MNALIKAAGVNAEPFWPSLFAKALANVNIESLTCSTGAAWPLLLLLPLLRRKEAGAATVEGAKQEAKKEEEECGGGMGFAFFNYTSFANMFNKKLNV
ncbi:60S acidic ribosomal protein P1 [Cricetulus griseus]|uniref:Large ribosomal subunit protein P2 n=1 Tax=Cricetulus griseus TaxID=10029 RepID=G3I1S0_CRIGR|nr:60S acidic ribosomal protein P1 [Cricetulus griseus]